MSLATSVTHGPEAALRGHISARSAHVCRLRALVRSVPAARLAAFVGASGQSPQAERFVKLRRGAYTLGADQLTPEDALIVMACAVHEAAGRAPVFSHDTARSIWGLPAIGPRCGLVEYTLPPGARGRTSNVRRRRTGLATTFVEIGGLRVTSYERTIVDHARHARLESGIAACDSALHLGLTTREALLTELCRVPRGARGRSMANLAVHLADGSAESPLESLSRTRMFQASLPMPQLQHWFDDGDGRIGRTDFYWPQLGLVGESDGELKYEMSQEDPGRGVIDALLREKKREQRLRRHPDIDDVARWDWGEALPPGKLHAVLAAHGVHPVLDGGWPVPDGPLPRRAFLQ